MVTHDPKVVHEAERERFVLRDAEHSARLAYHVDGDVIDLLHTEVPPALEGRGIGKSLARAALEYASSHRLQVRPTCRFVRAYLRRNPDAAKLAQGVTL
jgi:predicted GNAT family acetyltransferase